jgi:phospholipase C
MPMLRISRRAFLNHSGLAAALAMTAGLQACSGGGSGGNDEPVGDGDPTRGPNSLPDPTRAAGAADERLPFDHVIVVMMENHSFDNYFGMLPVRGQPKADGFLFDDGGAPINFNPLSGGYQRVFRMKGTCQPNGVNQSWNATHLQINDGKMDGFAPTDSEAMGYWDEDDIPFYYSLAKTFCLGNRCYCSLPGQTYPNRRFLYAGTAQGTVNTSLSSLSMPPPANGTLMDVMSRYGVSWRNYFTDVPALALIPENLVKHPQNFSLMAKFYDDCASGQLPAVSLVDAEFGLLDQVGSYLFSYLNQDIEKRFPGLPPEVMAAIQGLETKIRAQGGDEENPQDIAIGEAFVAKVVQAVMNTPLWPRTLLVWTYDEHGGYYDHVPPVAAVKPDDIPPDIGPDDFPGSYDITGLRIPTVVVSPYSRVGDVSNVTHDHTSIIATIARKWNLPALTYRDAQANSLLDFLNLQAAPAFLTPPTLAEPSKPSFARCQGAAPPPIIDPMPP